MADLKEQFMECMLVNYSGREKIQKHYPNALIFGNEKLGDFGFCTVKDDHVLIAVRGSDDWADWLSNLGIDINSGILTAIKTTLAIFKSKIDDRGYYKEFYDSVTPFINQIIGYVRQSDKTKVKLVGHSRGGALVQIIASRLVAHSRNIEVIAYGSPKVCTKKSRYYRDVKDGRINVTLPARGLDIVPRLPFEFPFSKNLVRVTGLTVIGQRPSFIQKLKMLKYAMTGRGKWEWFADHRPDSYMDSLDEM